MRTMAPPPAVSLVPYRDPRCQPHRGSFCVRGTPRHRTPMVMRAATDSRQDALALMAAKDAPDIPEN
jgi:hypothetical protein